MKILPDEIPEETAPLTEIPIPPVIGHATHCLIGGENVFVTLLDGRTLIGRCERNGIQHFTVGNSDPIDMVLVESARIV